MLACQHAVDTKMVIMANNIWITSTCWHWHIFMIYYTSYLWTRTVTSMFICIPMVVTIFSIQIVVAVLPISLYYCLYFFWDLLLCCYLFPSVLLCYLQSSPKGDQQRNILSSYLIVIVKYVSRLSFAFYPKQHCAKVQRHWGPYWHRCFSKISIFCCILAARPHVTAVLRPQKVETESKTKNCHFFNHWQTHYHHLHVRLFSNHVCVIRFFFFFFSFLLLCSLLANLWFTTVN